MKTLHDLLLHLSSKESASVSSSEFYLGELNAAHKRSGLKSNFRSFSCLTNFLFVDLDRRFKQLLSDIYRISNSDALQSASKREAYLWTAVEEFILVLRCCLVIITLITYDQILILEKVGILLSVLRTLTWLIASGENETDSISLEKSFSHECTISDIGSSATIFVSEDLVASLCLLAPSEPFRPLLCAVLEVFADELLAHRPLREYFILVDATSSISQMLFMHSIVHGEIGTVMEVISAHFVLSFSDERSYLFFLEKLYWQKSEEFRIPQLTLTTAISLFLNPIMLSMPKMVLAHTISLVSEVIRTSVFSKTSRPRPKVMDFYLIAFEQSVVLYIEHMSGMHKNTASKNSTPIFSSQPSFESYIQQIRWKKINYIISSSDKFWASYSFFKLKGDLLASSLVYVEENADILDQSFKDDGLSILHYIIVEAFNASCDTERYKKDDTSPHDFYVLASLLKLMSITMLSVISCIKHSGKSRSRKTSKDGSSCKEYDFILDIISRFRELDVGFPNHTLLSDIIGRHPYNESKTMLLHFAGVLALSFSSGSDFLVKDCIYLLMVVLNLCIFEDGNLDVYASLCQSRPRSFSANETVEYHKSTIRVASKFQKIQTLNLSMDPRMGSNGFQDEQPENSEQASTSNHMNTSYVGLEKETEETCNGEVFLSCLIDDYRNTSSYDDITDFIELKPRKDYVHWLKNRQRYKKWRSERQAILRWKKKKQVWKIIRTERT